MTRDFLPNYKFVRLKLEFETAGKQFRIVFRDFFPKRAYDGIIGQVIKEPPKFGALPCCWQPDERGSRPCTQMPM